MNLVNGIFALSLMTSNVVPLAVIDGTTKAETATIETTNVSYDLNLFSNDGKYDYTFDWTKNNKVQFDKYGKPSNSDYSDFKFLVIKPVLGDIYVYFYWKASTPYIPTLGKCYVDLSMSTQKADDGSYIEDISTYDATLVNTYGTHDVWMKYKISDAYEVTPNTSYRIFVDSLKFDYVYHGCVGESQNYIVGNSIIFQTNEDDDFVYDYWRKDYVTIADGKVASYLVPKELVKAPNNTSVGSSYNEYSYYFFNTDEDHPISDLISVTYNYYLLTYDVKFSFDTYRTVKHLGDDLYDFNYFCYPGLYNGSTDAVTHPFGEASITNKKLDFSVVSDEFKSNQITSSGTTTVEVDRPLLNWLPFWGKQKVSYQFDSIQDLTDISSIPDNDLYSAYKSFIVNNYKDNEGQPYSWAFRIDNSDLYRYFLNNGQINYNTFFSTQYWHGIFANCYINSRCHEVEQALVTHLTYLNDNKFYSLDVLDTPKDTVSIEVDVVPYKDLTDMFFDKVQNVISLFVDAINKIRIGIAVAFAVLIGIVLFKLISKIVRFFKLIKRAKAKRKK